MDNNDIKNHVIIENDIKNITLPKNSIPTTIVPTTIVPTTIVPTTIVPTTIINNCNSNNDVLCYPEGIYNWIFNTCFIHIIHIALAFYNELYMCGMMGLYYLQPH